MRAAIYARVSTVDQHCEMQLRELREYCQRRGWTIAGEYVDRLERSEGQPARAGPHHAGCRGA